MPTRMMSASPPPTAPPNIAAVCSFPCLLSDEGIDEEEEEVVAEPIEVEEVEEVEEPAVEEGEFKLIQLESVDIPTVRRWLSPPDRPWASCATQTNCVPAGMSTVQVSSFCDVVSENVSP